VSLRIISLILLTTTMMFAMGSAAHRVGAGVPRLDSCTAPGSFRTLTLTVPANRAVTFPLVDLLPEAEPGALATDAKLAITRPDGSLRFAANTIAEAHLSPSGLTYEPSPGFTGASSGWVLTGPTTGEGGSNLRPDCGGADAGNFRLETVLVTFEVRNTLPQAFDDQVEMPSVADLMDVGPESGVLANDLDVNGDALVVHAATTTTFPWGSVNMASDGSYRVTITNHDLLGPATVRYLVWDRQGSPTSVDTGYLEIDFTAG
jgi:hypothetical protein